MFDSGLERRSHVRILIQFHEKSEPIALIPHVNYFVMVVSSCFFNLAGDLLHRV